MLTGKIRVRPEIVKVEGPSMEIAGNVEIRMPRPDKVLLVVQVEEAAYRAPHVIHGPKWRDGTVEDLSEVDVGKLSLGLKSISTELAPTQLPVMPLLALLEIYTIGNSRNYGEKVNLDWLFQQKLIEHSKDTRGTLATTKAGYDLIQTITKIELPV